MIVIIGIALLIALLVMGVPVALCFGGATLFLVAALGYSPLFLVPYGYSSIASVTLWCIPLFIIAGNVIKRGKIGDALVNFVDQFVGKVFKSGLGMVTVVTCGIFGAIAGNGSATMSAIGSIMVPKLKEKGYPRGVSAALIASASVLGLLIPPSSAQIVYAWAANQSVLACFLATVIPGILLAVLLCIVQAFMVRRIKMKPFEEDGGGQVRRSGGRRLLSRTGRALPALFMPVLILGGIYGGVMTPMESAAIATLYCIPVAIFFYKGMRFRDLGSCLVESGRASGNVAVMLMTAMLFSRILTMEKVPDMMVSVMTGITDNKYLILLLVNILLFIVGMLMEDGCGIMLCTPLLLPVVQAVGVSPIQFAAIIGVNLGMGLITPPTAPLLYFASQVGEAPIGEMLRPTLLFILFAWLPTTLLTTYIPALSLTLPRLIMGLNV